MKKILISLFLISTLVFSGCTAIPDWGNSYDSGSAQNTNDAPKDPVSLEKPVQATDGHTDGNNDGICDDCNESVIITIDFYAINDLHGKFADSDSNVGVDELTTYLKYAYKNDDHSITLASGDMWQGGAESNLTKGLIVTEWMNHIGVESMTLGNHEFDWGVDAIKANSEIASFPLLAINIFERDTDELADYCSPSVIVERAGIQIGIIGAIGDCYSSISAEQVGDVYFKDGDELTELIKDESDKLKEQGADYIVLSIHDGHDKSSSGMSGIDNNSLSSYYDPDLSRDGYVDMVFEGHTHKSYVLRDKYGVFHFQDGGDNRGISHAEVNINFANWENSVTVAEFIEDDDYKNMPDDAIVNTLCDKYGDDIKKAYETIGYNSVYRSSDFLRQLVANLYYEKGIEQWGDEYDIVLGGGFISARSPYELNKGEVKYATLMSIFPFDNQLVLCSVSGKDLLDKFVNTTNSNYYVYYDSSVIDNIDRNKTYYIIVDTYTSTYKYNNLKEIARYDGGVFARDLLAEYIRNGGLDT